MRCYKSYCFVAVRLDATPYYNVYIIIMLHYISIFSFMAMFLYHPSAMQRYK